MNRTLPHSNVDFFFFNKHNLYRLNETKMNDFLLGTLYLLKKRDSAPSIEKSLPSATTNESSVSKTVIEYV